MSIQARNARIEQEARKHQNKLTKPQGALGRLEDIACWFASCQGKVIPDRLTPHICIFAADHGVTEEGVSAFPSVVTAEMVKNFAHGGAAINVLANQAGATLNVVDVGVLLNTSDIPGIIQHKVRAGTANIKKQPAMTPAECEQAIRTGKNAARQAIKQGANVLIAGDMGIGNTTPSACLISLFAGLEPKDVVGYGTGLEDKANKVRVVEETIRRIKSARIAPSAYLQQAGGLEIAAIAGYYLEAASQGIPIILDGFITTAAAMAAREIDPQIISWMLASHQSQELGHKLALQHLGLSPLLDWQLRLGEGSGAALILPVLQSAIALHRDMATFESAGVSDKDAI